MHVVFVDDDEQVLHGLRRMLRPHTKEWDVSFALSGPEALGIVAASTVDVVVTDMRMPGMDGIELMSELHTHHPEVVRIVLSGHSQTSMSLRSTQLAHQFLTKPCDADTLRATVQRACALHERLGSEKLRSLVGRLSSLPSPPRVIDELNGLLALPDPSLEEVGALVATDPALSAKLLQLVNSAFFGLAHRRSSVQDAVNYLGFNVLRNLAVALSANDAFEGSVLSPLLLKGEQDHAMAVSDIVRELAPHPRMEHDAFAVGLLHDLGVLALSVTLPDEYWAVRTLAVDEHLTLIEAEREVLGTTHADVGAYVLSLWGLPQPLVEAVAMHHDAPVLSHRTLDLVHCVHIAEQLVTHAGARPRLGGAIAAPLDAQYLEELGVTDQVSELATRLERP